MDKMITQPQSAGISEEFWREFYGGNRRACARLITKVENEPSSVPLVRETVASKLGRAVRIGITGPPGVGKSTISSALAHGLALRDHHVGVIAVDPSSPFTGGAFMGDRVRMDQLVGNERVYVRSLASRDGRGGLSPATPYVADVIEAFGMDRIIIETVGIGQAEIDVLACTDIVVLVLQPSTGDAIQTLKAGIIEGADLIVVNKADLPGVDSVLQSLRFLFSLGGPRRGKPIPPVISTSAQQNTGLDKVIEELEKQAEHLISSGLHFEMRKARMEKEIQEAIQQNLWERYEALANPEEIKQKADELAKSGGSPYSYVREACARVEMKWMEERR